MMTGELYAHEVFAHHLDTNAGGLLEHYSRAHNEGETTIAALWVIHHHDRPVAVAVIDHGLRAMVHVYVRPEHRGQGLGRALMEGVIESPVGPSLVANYTLEAERLFRRAGCAVANPEHWAALRMSAKDAPPSCTRSRRRPT